MKFYLSGPMTGYPNSNYDYFENTVTWLRKHYPDDTFISPHEIPKQASYDDYMREGIRLLLDCDAIVLLAGWPNSRGSNVELAVALSMSCDVFYYHHDGNLIET